MAKRRKDSKGRVLRPGEDAMRRLKIGESHSQDELERSII